MRVGGSPQTARHNNSVLSRANVDKAEQTLTIVSWSQDRVEVRGDFIFTFILVHVHHSSIVTLCIISE